MRGDDRTRHKGKIYLLAKNSLHGPYYAAAQISLHRIVCGADVVTIEKPISATIRIES